MANMGNLIGLIERLTGQDIPFPNNKERLSEYPFKSGGIGHNQLNEILLTLGYDRVTNPYFRYFFGNVDKVTSYEDFSEAVQKARKISMLLYGNVKYGFKRLGRMHDDELARELASCQPISPDRYSSRAAAVHRIREIQPQDAYLFGYIVERTIKEQLAADPGNKDLQVSLSRMEEVRKIGRDNLDAYLTYDHMDVYIATSMREKHEFHLVHGFVKELFRHELLAPLKLRYFDPTQAYCPDRIDKGLVEALMVKRAKCTIYLAQENDTLGKDSELAATLAQGKPVIAYVPRLVNEAEFIAHAAKVKEELYPEIDARMMVLRLLREYCPSGAWEDTRVRKWLDDPSSMNEEEAVALLFRKARELYEFRASVLRESHPLALQVNLATGVANGVLLVRTVAECAELLRRIVLNRVEYDIEEIRQEGPPTFVLREKLTRSIYRVVTGDDLLTNSFWNFYLQQSGERRS